MHCFYFLDEDHRQLITNVLSDCYSEDGTLLHVASKVMYTYRVTIIIRWNIYYCVASMVMY